MDETSMRRAIERKREGEALSGGDWEAIVAGFMAGSVDDAQMAALCMACLWRGMTFEEAYALTRAMVDSGETIAFDSSATVVDKHSSGGVSDIVSLVAVPLAAACGVRVAKLSGRALGHTGGTIDKLETIPGFNVNLSIDAFKRQVERVGCAIAAQSETLVPADKRIYRLRDHTGTVPVMGLMAASIVSKKIAGGAHAFVFDVKTGRGGFMQDARAAHELAGWLVEIARRFGRRATAFVTNMDEPLGHSIGTGIEVIEARNFLTRHAESPPCHPEPVEGQEPPEGREHTLVLRIVEAMLEAAGIEGGAGRVRAALQSGAGYEKLVAMVEAQGSSRAALESLHVDANPSVVASSHAGWVRAMDVVRLGNVGRRLAEHDPAGGLRVAVRIGDHVERGAPLAYVYGTDRDAARSLESAFEIAPEVVAPTPVIVSSS
ncbi:MAG: thymidine phosphorylase [Vulcanimicrobiaceae bacterium]